MSSTALRIAMWSGPRNISTALLRSFGNRADAFVSDEPLYAHYLAHTRAPHPGADEVIANHEADWHKVVEWLGGPLPPGKRVWYQKHMAHHLLPHVERGWVFGLANAFLIRDPREMLLSLDQVTPGPSVSDTGLLQQVELFRELEARAGERAPVIDAKDVLESPEPLLRRLCDALGIAFDPAMLRWEPGRRSTDGVWAKHWYAEVERSSGFARWRPRAGELPAHLARVHADCLPLYRFLHEQRLVA